MSRLLDSIKKVETWLKSGRFPEKLSSFIVTGTADYLTDPAGASFASEKIKNSKFFKYEGAHHCIHIELPEVSNQFYEDMTSWIEDQLKKHSQN